MIYDKNIINWSDELNSIPTLAIKKLYTGGLDTIVELTENNEKSEFLPTYEEMWHSGYGIENIFIVRNIDKMQDIGFRVYDSHTFGIIFGIDNDKFDFYEHYWQPLYNIVHNQ